MRARKKNLKRRGFLGVREEESGRFAGDFLTCINVFRRAGRVGRMAFMTTKKGCSKLSLLSSEDKTTTKTTKTTNKELS